MVFFGHIIELMWGLFIIINYYDDNVLLSLLKV